MRTFTALKIPAGNKLMETIFTLQKQLREEKIKWVEPGNLHLTLFFLGETPESLIQTITSGLEKEAAKNLQMKIRLSGMGVFRDFRNPRVIWIGIEPEPALSVLQSRIDSLLTDLGFKPDNRPFNPHLTVGRPKWIRDKMKFRESIETYKTCFFQESVVREIILFESKLTGSGPIYKPVSVCSLKAV
ncbi:MAG: RNA 2',3'-cyclic phosphodiesterase [Bacteroidales bacterium]|nr:MAG: RNA 2',3'-cyclic phosphodiesterase [Bacteroidales bacterium]